MSNMSRKEAIDWLCRLRSWIAIYIPRNKQKCKQALDFAIKSLETDEAYQLEYERTTKNDLGVDWESYKDADGNNLDDLILEVLQNNFDCGNTYGYKVADEIIGLLPSVTPQEPRKGHWISHIEHCKQNNLLPSGLGSYFWCSECNCGIDSKNFARVNYNYCPNCGADMREVEE